MRLAFADSLIALANENPRLFLLTGDLGFASFDAFRHAHPDRFINVGVAEQNLVAVATGVGYWKYMPWGYRLKTHIFFHVFTP